MRMRPQEHNRPVVKSTLAGARYSRKLPASYTPPIYRLQKVMGNRAVQRLVSSGLIQGKLHVNQPGDQYEQEADRVADKVMTMPEANGERLRRQEDEEQQALQTKSDSAQNHVSPAVEANIQSLMGGGRPLRDDTRRFFEPRFGYDFSGVRIHSDEPAAQTARAVNAQAFTLGRNIVFGAGQYSPETINGKRLLAHELTHVVQQQAMPARLVKNKLQPRIQRRLVTFGGPADVNALLGLLGPRAGLTLAMNPVNNQVQITAVSPAAPPSATLRARLTTIINHATQHAEISVARGQPLVFVGAFPQPTDLTVTRVQRVDIDDILAIEAGAPGNGVAFAMHEIEENFQAHGVAPVAGTNRFPAAHQAAINTAENPVARELVGPGRRIAQVTVPGSIFPTLSIFGFRIPGTVIPVANMTAIFLDYENYYVGMTMHLDPATRDARVVNSNRFAPTIVSSRTIDNYVTGSDAVPAAGAAAIAAAAADVAANPTASVRIRGFTDDVGTANSNLTLSQRRANLARTALQNAGVAPANRMHAEGLGETNFVAPNATAADRARNRRVVITVARPTL
jgi:outer membrane protein OmpA-like peptidoglycan-associated protein